MSFFFDTKILQPSLRIPKGVQYLFKFLRLISDRFAVFLASKLFTTPIDFKTPQRELEMSKNSQKETLYVPSIKKYIHVLTYGSAQKRVLLAHGWAGRSTQLFAMAKALLNKGYMIISLDAPAHAKSSGKTTNLMEYIEAITALNIKFGPFNAAIGHSFGAMAIINNQAKTRQFNCLITVGSGDKVSDILKNFARNLGLDHKFGQKLISFLEKKWNVNIDDFATSFVAKNLEIPVLVVHDTLDGDVPVSCAFRIRQNLKKGTLFVTHGLGHTKILRDQMVTEKITYFINQNT